MRYPKIIDEPDGGMITIVRLVLTVHNPVAFVVIYNSNDFRFYK